MRSFTGAAIAASLIACLVPQTALGLAKPSLTAHPDVAPTDAVAMTGPEGAWQSLPLQPASVVLGLASGGTNSIAFASLATGDIIVVMDPTSVTGHAGMFDRSRYSSIMSYAVLSANVAPVNGVQIEKCAKYRLYNRAYGLRVTQEYAHRFAVRDFALGQVGKPYSVFAAKTDLRSFYCSKLPWAAYHSVTGVDLDADGGIWVWPVDLLASRYTTLVGYWS